MICDLLVLKIIQRTMTCSRISLLSNYDGQTELAQTITLSTRPTTWKTSMRIGTIYTSFVD
jgi:hypothetical protein